MDAIKNSVETLANEGHRDIQIEIGCGTEGWTYVSTQEKIHVIDPNGNFFSEFTDEEFQEWSEEYNGS